jgi:uncharacterized membrane protein YfcA
MDWVVVLALGLAAGTISGVVGFGTSIILLPALVIVFGPREAVPIMAITAILANLSRMGVWWRDVNWKVCAAYSSTAIPCAALGATTLLSLSTRVVELSMGVFFLLMIPGRRWLQATGFRMKLWQFIPVGAVIGFLTGIVVSTGPINTPFFIAYGLVKGPFLATEAMSSLGMYVTKSAVFQGFGALPWDIAVKGMIVGSSVMVGSWLSKRIVLRMDAAHFKLVMDGMMLVAALTMLVSALH